MKRSFCNSIKKENRIKSLNITEKRRKETKKRREEKKRKKKKSGRKQESCGGHAERAASDRLVFLLHFTPSKMPPVGLQSPTQLNILKYILIH